MCCFWAIFSLFCQKTTFLSVLRFSGLEIEISSFHEIASCRGDFVVEISPCRRYFRLRNLTYRVDFETSKCTRVGYISRSKNRRVTDFSSKFLPCRQNFEFTKSRSCSPRFRESAKYARAGHISSSKNRRVGDFSFRNLSRVSPNSPNFGPGPEPRTGPDTNPSSHIMRSSGNGFCALLCLASSSDEKIDRLTIIFDPRLCKYKQRQKSA